ncbi:hypothetical protein [Aeromonas rivipollensis]|uniref:hypothetical protein n=1 Tax=Aeromonas rivipollensis TaxID=948519 RepID=UPI003D1CC811
MKAPPTDSDDSATLSPDNAILSSVQPSILQRCDNGLMGLCQRLCHWLGQLLLLGLGCCYVWRFVTTIFEYGEGLADMDIFEEGTLLLLALLLWRHWRYCQYCATSFWQRLLRPLQSWGRVFVVELVVVAIIFAIDATLLSNDAGQFKDYVIYDRLLDPLLFLGALYLAAPRFQRPSPISSTEQVS